jgi:hypothetical protein
MDEDLLILGDSVDHLVTLDMKWPGRPRGVVDTIYTACRNYVGEPICLAAAKSIQKKVTEKSTVVISTGFVLPPFFPLGETDGPPGAVSIAYAIHHGIGARIVFLTEKEVVNPLKDTCVAAGLAVYNPSEFNSIPGSITVQDFPVETNLADKEGKRILDELKPSAVITVEKMGRNEKNVYHTARGNDIGMYTAKIDLLVEEAQKREILTIGIGDLGNEIGLGSVANVVKKAIGPLGEKCHCGCGGGIVTKVGTEIPIMATMSNWGGYGVSACLAALLGKKEVLHSTMIEKRMIEASVRAGTRDGATVGPTLSSDGVSLEGNQATVQLLHEIIRIKTTQTKPYRT